ncbi:myelin regulatory factor-like protein isoform X2 [Macrosteles quadrilineatus]|uniref:myelin regulatory factor-like protein isoform X2 n=1 Tax=Macrosteles quadrilineatus TaxID=74068 RepID=UPI0023E2770B|nr:myelin regulatory factor-like protein isoform X2 [Macrosteles quadrilineatus]
MDGLDIQDLQAVLGRSDFVGGIDNEALDFSQLEDFINDDTDENHTYFGDTLTNNEGRNLATVVDSHNHLKTVGSQPQPVASAVLSTPSSSFPQPTSSVLVDGSSYTHPHSLPESPPDSGSEPPYSPQAHSPHQKNGPTSGLTDLLMQSPVYGKPPHTIHIQAADTILVQHPSVLTPLLTHQQQSTPPVIQNNNTLALAAAHAGLSTTTLTEDQSDSGITTIYTSLHHGTKKRKLSEDNVRVKQETELCGDEELSFQEGSGEGSLYLDSSSFQCIRFTPFQQPSWHTLCDQNIKELPPPHYRVDADKGFNFSNADDAFVCQKKNHFQITCHTQLQGDAQFVKTTDGLRKISSFHLHFYGVKVESPSQTIKVEQSQSDRSKKAFHPVFSRVDLHGEQVTKVTVGRLHFSETTSNNMRKKGKPNPDQRYFYLVVGLHAHCSDNTHYPIVSHASERIIVRAFLFQASNPGQFESDVELCWQRGAAADSIYHAGRVGVNTDRPDEALVVHGNMKVTGHIVQPSDLRAKRDIQECDSAQQLINVRQLRVVKYKYDPEFSNHCGLDTQSDTGIIAQELRNILPEAVMPAGDVVLPSGTRIDNFLVVNKERILMESVGAVKELCKVTDNLESRIGELERINKRLVKLKRLDSLKSNTSGYSSVTARTKLKSKHWEEEEDHIICSNQLIQVTIVILILIMAMCLMAMVALYIMEYQKRNTSFGFTEMAKSRFSNENLGQSRFRSTTMTSYWTLDVRPNISDYVNPKSDPKYSDVWSSGKKHPGSFPGLVRYPLCERGFSKKGSYSGGGGSLPGVMINTNTPSSPAIIASNCGLSDLATSCQTFCCTSTSAPSDNSISYQEQNYQFQRPDATPATNAIEELSENGSQDALSKEVGTKQREWIPTKDNLLPHKKQPADDFIQQENSFSSSDFSAAVERGGISVVVIGSAYNASVDHCSTDPYLPPHNFSCAESLNNYLPDPNITLHFKFIPGGRVHFCRETRVHKCSWTNQGVPTIEQIANDRFRVDVGHSLAVMLMFRLPYSDSSAQTVCSEPDKRIGTSFAEYNLYLYRACQG